MSSSYAPCAACKYLRRKCTQECVFAPYFPPDNPQKFINVHKVFGASNVGKILNELNPNQRNDAVNSLAYEAECRIKDPIYGCVGFVSILQQHLRQVHQEIDRAKKELATYIGPAALQPILNNNGPPHQNFDPYQPPQQQQMAPGREQEMMRACLQQQQQEQQLYMQQQEMYAQQHRMYQQQFNDAGDFVQIPAGLALGGGAFMENAYEQDHNSQQFQIQDLMLQGPQQQQLMQYHEFAGAQPQTSSQRDVIEEERSFSPL